MLDDHCRKKGARKRVGALKTHGALQSVLLPIFTWRCTLKKQCAGGSSVSGLGARVLALVASLALLLLSAVVPLSAQRLQPGDGLGQPYLPLSPDRLSEPSKTPGERWAAGRTSYLVGLEVAPYQHPGTGPDNFGYTWDDTVVYKWLDATAGSDTGIEGDDETGLVDIGFPFKFYEQTWSEVYVSTNGILVFGENDPGCCGRVPMPSPAEPNNVIAPFWDDLAIVCGDSPSGIYTLSGGLAPNRFFVVEWHDASAVCDAESSEPKTFQVILHENGDIIMQYQRLAGDLAWASVGIEDCLGADGLQYMGGVRDGLALLFKRPEPMARVGVWPPFQGRLTHAGESVAFAVPVRNTGELGTDTYDLTASSSWPVSYYAADGMTPLVDTNSNDQVDTGPIGQGETALVIVEVHAPTEAGAGDDNQALLSVRSSLDESVSGSVELQMAIAPAFAQVYQDAAGGLMGLYLVQPAGQELRLVTPDLAEDNQMTLAETSDGFIHLWNRWRMREGLDVGELEYTLLDRYGGTLLGVSKLTHHAAGTTNVYDWGPAAAAVPGGNIGVVWYRSLRNRSDGTHNQNIFLAVLDAAGSLLYGPVAVTDNDIWGGVGQIGVPTLWNPRITAAGDNFLLAWQREVETPDGRVENIYYAVRDSDGGEVLANTLLTGDGPGAHDGHFGVNLAPLRDGRTILTWVRSGHAGGVYYALFDEAGRVVKGPTNLGTGGSGIWYDSTDVAQMANGRIVVTWVKDRQVWFLVLDEAGDPVSEFTSLDNPAALAGDRYVSVAAAGEGAALTWMDFDRDYRRHLYYALLDGGGNPVSGPMIFRTSAGAKPDIFTSYGGYGNSAYRWMPPSAVDGVVSFDNAPFGVLPGGTAAVRLRYANHGQSTAQGVVLTATLEDGLRYMADTSGAAPEISGDDIVWSLPDLSLLESREFVLYVRIPPDTSLGSRYPLTLTLDSDGPEGNPADNVANTEVAVVERLYLPMAVWNY